uniref:Highly immunogenic outer capsid protein n=1 Tax=Klebsiella phage Phi_KR1 TaxID=3240396 RepID=A0AB39U0R4_9CAUD
MAYSVSIAPLAASAVIGATTNFTATTSGAAAEGTEAFVWTVNGVKQSSVTAAMNYVAAGPAGSKTVKVVATVTPAEGDPETAEAETTLTVKNKTMPAITLTLSPTSVSKEIGQSQVVTADVTGAPSGASIAYVWKRGSSVISGQTGKTITLTESTETSYTLNCEVTVSASDYNPATATKGVEVVFTKKVAPEPDGELPYIHPLPFRGTAYIWCGWWVMDEIQRMTVEGKDWKLDDPVSDYYLHRYTLAKMLDDYPEVDVQESRNGYIVHRTALEAGIIYP